MIKQILPTLKILALAVVLSFGISYALAWTAPTATPPTGNVSAPINTGSTKQVKLGDLCTSFSGTEKCLSSAQLAVPSTAFSVSPTIIQSGQTTTLTWSVTDATSCTASGSWAGTKAISGSEASSALSGTGGPISYTFTLSCTGAGGTTSKDVTVQVLAPFTATYSGGSGTSVSIPSGVTSIKFKAQGGTGMWGSSTSPNCGGAGGGASFAYYGAKVPIVVAGGGGGGACQRAGGAGGYTGASIHGGYGPGWTSSGWNGAVGNSSAGGDGGSITAAYPGGAGGSNATRGDGGSGVSQSGGSVALGGKGLINNGTGGTTNNAWYAGGGGGGLGGGGSGADYPYGGGGGGGGGSGYFIAGASAPDVNGFVTVPVSAMGNPASIYIWGGTGGGAAAAGYITMTW